MDDGQHTIALYSLYRYDHASCVLYCGMCLCWYALCFVYVGLCRYVYGYVATLDDATLDDATLTIRY